MKGIIMSRSKDYSKFNILSENRNIDHNHIDKIKESITKHGYLSSNPIIVDEKMNIIDGQHRFLACKEMGLPIDYEVIEDSESMIIDLNTTQKKWTIYDYLKYYAIKDNNENYIRVLNLMGKYKTSAQMIFSIALKRGMGGEITRTVRQGTLKFDVDDVARVEGCFKKIDTISKNLKKGKVTRMVQALMQISRNPLFNWDRMLRQSELYPTIAYNCRSIAEYIVMLKELYNFNIRKAAKL